LDILHKINQSLEELEEEKVKHFTNLNYPIIFIVAPPRSGTTLIYQLLTLKFDLFYPSNLLAKFYKSPYIFLEIIQDLVLNRKDSSFESYLGNTKGVLEPHEWGWFWEKLFFYNNNIVFNELCAIQQIFPKPMIFKNIYFNYEILRLEKKFLSPIFLRIVRDPYETIYSIYNAITLENKPIGSKKYEQFYKKFMNNKLELATLEYLYDSLILDRDLKGLNVIKIYYNDIISNTKKCLEKLVYDFHKITNINLKENNIKINQNNIKQKTILEEYDRKMIDIYLNKYKKLSLKELENIIFESCG